LRTGAQVGEDVIASVLGVAQEGDGSGGAVAGGPPQAPDDEICSCNAVTRGQIDTAIRVGGLTTLEQIGVATRASTGCGGCARDVVAILTEHAARSSDGNIGGTVGKPATGTIAA
jgi:NAD(P)H-nitrite reductase large subunit